ncbi:MAG: two-component sensor histidine kinase [Desulfovibrionales bacterium]|nr:MAG: two-component sensor histidine kinase [Desulfovibrionales bacterium]
MQKRLITAVITALLLLSGIIFSLASWANKELERIVSGQFNEQQLVLARKIALNVAEDFALLDAALDNFSRLQAHDPQNHASIQETYRFLKNRGVLGVGIYRNTPEAGVDVYTSQGWTTLAELGLSPPMDTLPPTGLESTTQSVLSRTQFLETGSLQGHWVMTMTLTFPRDPDHPEAKVGCLFILDAQAIARKSAQGVRSGKTGYAWVIDHNAYFMYHVEEDFDGQDSMTIRQARNPAISYQRINDLVRHRLLRGEEGTDWYISGWHWEVIREMRKLFAFSPVILSQENGQPAHTWSVGLAAPDTEVFGLIQPIVIRQWLIIGLFFGVVTTAFAGFLFIALRWSEALKKEVEKKTQHLQRSETSLRQERDKVRQSMEQLLETQEKLLISERFAAIGEAAAHLSHEIKNPLMLMAGFAQQVLRSLPEDDSRREKLDIVVNEAKRLERLLVDVRDFTRPPRPQHSTTQINEVVRDVAEIFQDQCESQNVQCRLALDSGLPVCLVDPSHIKQVLLNLAKNAVEAMPDGGEVTISTAHGPDSIQVSVQDTGPGIPPEVLKRLFHPFFSTKPKGTGLGLAISFKLVQDHGGEIKVRSQVGCGARFDVYIPLKTINASSDLDAQDCKATEQS